MPEILKVENLSTHFSTEAGTVKAVDDTSFHIGEKEIVGIVGESSCGKLVSLLSVLQLVKAPGRIVGGKTFLKEKICFNIRPTARGCGQFAVREFQ